MMCSAETVISILQIPLQLKLLHPWNRGIHGYIRSHVKGSLSVSLFFSSPHLFSSFIIWKKSLCHPKVSDGYDLVLQMRFAVNNFNNIDEDRLAIKYLLNYECKPYYICSYLLDFEGVKRRASVLQCHRGCRLKYCIGASPIRRICSLQNNLLPWQRNFIIQAHCYLLSQQESNVS